MFRRYVFAVFLLIAFTRPVCAQDSAQGQAFAEVVAGPVAVEGRTPLRFGYLLPNTQGGTVVVTPKNTRRVTGGVRVKPNGFARAAFFIRGGARQSYSIQVPQSVMFKADSMPKSLLLASAPNWTLVATDFTVESIVAGPVADRSQLDAQGKDTLYVGGTLIVPKGVLASTYSGFVPLTVSY